MDDRSCATKTLGDPHGRGIRPAREMHDTTSELAPHVEFGAALHRHDLVGGSILVEAFRAAFTAGTAAEPARELAPPAFTLAVNDKIALDLFAAAER